MKLINYIRKNNTKNSLIFHTSGSNEVTSLYYEIHEKLAERNISELPSYFELDNKKYSITQLNSTPHSVDENNPHTFVISQLQFKKFFS